MQVINAWLSKAIREVETTQGQYAKQNERIPNVEDGGEHAEQAPITRQGPTGVHARWIQALPALVRSLQASAQALHPWFNRLTRSRGLRTALVILSALIFCPAVLSMLTSISVTAKNQNVNPIQTKIYSTKQVSWSSTSTSAATVKASGVATATAEAMAISATPSGKRSSASSTDVSNAAGREIFCGGKNATVALPNCDPADPTQNTVFITRMPDTSTYTVVEVNADGNLQAAINHASCSPTGTIIKLQAGATFNSGFGSSVWGNGPYQLPKKVCAPGQWIIVESSNISSLPAPGTRVSPSDAVNMPKIQSVGGLPAIGVVQRANHYRFIGIEFSVPANTDTVVLVDFDAYDNGYPGAQNDHMIIDRCYIHGNKDLAHDYRRGISAQGSFFAALDSYINQFHSNTANSGADTQAIAMWAVSGPFKIINNYLSSSGENILSGGVPNGGNGSPHDFEIRHNHFYKPASLWRGSTGIVVKNLFELKNAVRLLIDGNVFDTTWEQAQDVALAWKVSCIDSGPGCATHDITFTHNLVIHAPNAMIFVFDGSTGPNLSKMLFQNNLFLDISNTTWASGTRGVFLFDSDMNTSNIIIDHNTALVTGPSISGALEFGSNGASGTIGTFTFTNNILNYGANGVFDIDRGNPPGNATINSYIPFSAGTVWNQNVFISGTSRASIYPSGTLWATPNSKAVGFTDNTNCVAGTFTASACQLTSTSPYHNAGSDGKDIGANIDSINSATTGVIQVHD